MVIAQVQQLYVHPFTNIVCSDSLTNLIPSNIDLNGKRKNAIKLVHTLYIVGLSTMSTQAITFFIISQSHRKSVWTTI